ncbi:MAG: DUF839 domain-containing protein [Gammaproteobacteria bacterium]|jgi:hypothetical protein
MFHKNLISAAVMLASTQAAFAATDVYFNPLTQSAAVAQVPNHINELNSPWQVPAGVSYTNLTSLHEIESDPSQSTVRVPGLGSNASMTDMSAFDPTGRYIFLPHETQYGAGLTRYDTETDKAVNLFHGDGAGQAPNNDWSNDYGALDPATWTPVDTLLVAEEWSGQGRVFEVVNPMADVAAGEAVIVNELNSIPNVSHEGLRFNHAGTALYFVDEDHSGSIYKFVPSVAGDYSNGQTFVLAADAFTGDPSINGNAAGDRTGMARWIALTDADGVALTAADPFDNASRGGRAAADEIGSTPFDRPEDVEVGYLRNGHEVLYFNATSENAVYSVEELGNGETMVRLAASEAATPKNLGYAGTTGHLSSPDNLAQDALGNIYVVEDKPNGDNIGGDIWFLRDANGDGVAESLDHFMSLQVKGAENTGMIFRPGHPTQFIINVQHPESTGETDGQGDATWLIDVKDVVAPPCVKDDGHHKHHHHKLKTCSDSDDTNFVKKLIKAGE